MFLTLVLSSLFFLSPSDFLLSILPLSFFFTSFGFVVVAIASFSLFIASTVFFILSTSPYFSISFSYFTIKIASFIFPIFLSFPATNIFSTNNLFKIFCFSFFTLFCFMLFFLNYYYITLICLFLNKLDILYYY